jgi:hypothetical protein
MRPEQMKLMRLLPTLAALVVVLAMLSSACINLMTEPLVLSAGSSTSQPAQPQIPPPSNPIQLASLETRGNHRVTFTYYNGSELQTWAIRTVSYPDTTLKDFPPGSPSLPGHVFVRWIHADTRTDPVSYPEFTANTPVLGDIEVRAYHQALPTLSYDANGAEGPAPASVSVLKAGEAVRLAGMGGLTAPEGTVFGGWSTREWTGSTFVQSGQYRAGELYQLGCSITLYARWDALP